MNHAEARAIAESGGGYMTGLPIADFVDGWAVHPFVGHAGHRSHWWRISQTAGGMSSVRTLCGTESVISRQVALLARGNWPQCQRCMTKYRALQR